MHRLGWMVAGGLVVAALGCSDDDSGGSGGAGGSATTSTTSTTNPCPSGQAVAAVFSGACDLLGEEGEVTLDIDIDPTACTAAASLTVTAIDDAGVRVDKLWGVEAPFGPLPLSLVHDPAVASVGVPAAAESGDTAEFTIHYDDAFGDDWAVFGISGEGAFACTLARQ